MTSLFTIFMFMLILPQEPDESTYFNEWWKSGDAVWRYRLTGKFNVTEMVIYAMCREIAFCWTQMGPSCTLKTLKECCLHQLLGGTRDRIGDACFNPVTWGVLVYFSRHLILQSWGWKHLAPQEKKKWTRVRRFKFSNHWNFIEEKRGNEIVVLI